MDQTTAKSRYEALKTKRQPFLDRARTYCDLTIPSLLSPVGTTGLRLNEPYQGFGARACVYLSSRLMSALLPPGVPFFRLNIPAETRLKSGTAIVPPDIESGLAQAEELIMSEIERRGWRAPTYLSLLLLVITGNALEQVMPDNRIRVFRLDQYVVVRDPAGHVTELLIEETVNPSTLPDDVAKLVTTDSRKMDPNATVCLYTWCVLKPNGEFDCSQWIEDQKIEKNSGSYKVLPFTPLRWAAIPGEEYGRSKVEEHVGDLRALEGLSKSLIDGAAMAARHVIMVSPNAIGGNLKKRIAEARNGDVVVGDPEAVSMLKFENTQGLQIAQAEVDRLTNQLAGAFLMTSGQVRQAERVTATEVRMVAEELEGVLGGVYSMLSQDMQHARLSRLIAQMQKNQQLPPWERSQVEPQIITGLDALRRERDAMRAQQAIQLIQGLPPEQLDYVKMSDLLKTLFIGLGLPAAVRTDAEVQQIQQERALQQAAARGIESAASAVGDAVANPDAGAAPAVPTQ